MPGYRAWTIGGGTGPVVGGALAQSGQWRWLFYLNLPICAVAGLLVATFLRLRIPHAPLRERLGKMDWMWVPLFAHRCISLIGLLSGNLLIIASTTSVVIALTWGGVQFPWNSARVLVPLILGLLGLCGFIAYEAWAPTYPTVRSSLTELHRDPDICLQAPISLMSTRTAFSGYAQNFLMSVVLAALACTYFCVFSLSRRYN